MKLYLKGYSIIISKMAGKEMKKIDKINAANIVAKLTMIVSKNSDFNVKKLRTYKKPRYSLRCGVYRAIFDIKNDVLVLLVVDVGHRKEIYKRKRK